MRLLALLLLFAVLPTVEVTEQAVHVVAHVFEAEAADHGAHHDDEHGDEHGCTGLVHLCSCHQTQLTPAVTVLATSTVETLKTVPLEIPAKLRDLHAREPLHRPPIA